MSYHGIIINSLITQSIKQFMTLWMVLWQPFSSFILYLLFSFSLLQCDCLVVYILWCYAWYLFKIVHRNNRYLRWMVWNFKLTSQSLCDTTLKKDSSYHICFDLCLNNSKQKISAISSKFKFFVHTPLLISYWLFNFVFWKDFWE